MVDCSFCQKKVPAGTGLMLAKTNGKLLYFCASKCEKNMLKLKRKARKTRWTNEAHEIKKSKA